MDRLRASARLLWPAFPLFSPPLHRLMSAMEVKS